MRIGYDHKNRLLVAADTEALGHLLIEVATDRYAQTCKIVTMSTDTLAAVRANAIEMLDELRAEVLAAELTTDDLG